MTGNGGDGLQILQIADHPRISAALVEMSGILRDGVRVSYLTAAQLRALADELDGLPGTAAAAQEVLPMVLNGRFVGLIQVSWPLSAPAFLPALYRDRP